MFAYVFKDSEASRKSWLKRKRKPQEQGWHSLLSRLRKPDGGFTYNPTLKSEPRTGFALSIYPERSAAFDSDKMEFLDLIKYVAKNKDILGQEGSHIGAWHDPATHKVYLDVSMVTNDAAKARALSLKHDQIAYFDLAKGVSVEVNRNATSGGVAKSDKNKPELHLSNDFSPQALADLWVKITGSEPSAEDLKAAEQELSKQA